MILVVRIWWYISLANYLLNSRLLSVKSNQTDISQRWQLLYIISGWVCVQTRTPLGLTIRLDLPYNLRRLKVSSKSIHWWLKAVFPFQRSGLTHWSSVFVTVPIVRRLIPVSDISHHTNVLSFVCYQTFSTKPLRNKSKQSTFNHLRLQDGR